MADAEIDWVNMEVALPSNLAPETTDFEMVM